MNRPDCDRKLSSTVAEDVLDLIQLIATATSIVEVKKAWEAVARRYVGSAYISLWITDEETDSVLLVHEAGVLHGATVQPDHNRVRLGQGVAGRAAQRNAVDRYDMADSDERAQALNQALIETERIQHLTALPCHVRQNSGVVLVGWRCGSPDRAAEAAVQSLAGEALAGLASFVRDSALKVLPEILSATRVSESADGTLARAIELLGRRLEIDAAFALDQRWGEASCVTLDVESGELEEQPVPRIPGPLLLRLPPAARLFRAVDRDEYRQIGLPISLVQRYKSFAPSRANNTSHALIASTHEGRPDSGITHAGIVVLFRSSEHLAFLPAEVSAVLQTVKHVFSLVWMNTRDRARSQLIQTAADVAETQDLGLAMTNAFLGLEQVVPFERGAIIFSEAPGGDAPFKYDRRRKSFSLDPKSSSLSQSEDHISLIEFPGRPSFYPADRAASAELVVPIQGKGGNAGYLLLEFAEAVPEISSDLVQYLSLLSAQIGLTRSVAELRSSQDLLEKLLDQFGRISSSAILSIGLSHEMKNHIGAFKLDFATVKELADSLTSPRTDLVKAQRTLRQMSSDNTDLIDQVTQLTMAMEMAFTSRNASNQDIAPESVFLNQVLRLYARGLSVAARERDITLNIAGLDSALDRPRSGRGNPLKAARFAGVRVGQIFTNLVTNAFNASPKRGVVDVRTEIRRDADGAARSAILEVEDHGSGMDDETKHRLYDPFWTTKNSGFGLGMYISRAAAADLGATIDFSTKVGRGSIFEVELPLA